MILKPSSSGGKRRRKGKIWREREGEIRDSGECFFTCAETDAGKERKSIK
jgi:hypothetical protein